MNGRLVAVLGYSDSETSGLHPVCATRLRRAADVARPEDTVLFSGWARRKTGRPEAELMAQAWTGAARRIGLDRTARSTVGNAIAVARAARSLGTDEVVVVTSSWHARRASVLVRAALLGSGARLVLVATEERATRGARVRELACWSFVPVLAVLAARTR